MESPCYRCGTPVEEGSAFCPSCNAPQIKVTASQPPASERLIQPPFPEPPAMVSPETMPVGPAPSGAIDWKRYRRLALPLSLLAGAGITVFAPLGLLFFVASIVFIIGWYRREHQGPLRALQGAKMGAFNGLISFLTAAALDAVLFRDEYRQQVMLSLQKQFGGNPDPNIQQLLHWFSTNQGFAVLVLLSLLFGLAIFLVVSSFIGAIAVSFSANRNRR